MIMKPLQLCFSKLQLFKKMVRKTLPFLLLSKKKKNLHLLTGCSEKIQNSVISKSVWMRLFLCLRRHSRPILASMDVVKFNTLIRNILKSPCKKKKKSPCHITHPCPSHCTKNSNH